MKKEYNVFDYMYWRGDLPFESSPFNEIDNLILSMICFFDFSGIVPALPSHDSVSLRYAVEEYLSRADKTRHLGAIIPDAIIDLGEKAASSKRFGSLQVTAYENTVVEEREMQFAALTYLLPYGDMFISFRGTDDTLVGWREDFDMTLEKQVQSQKRATEYLNAVYGTHKRPYYTGGHSKGGNLAVWSSLNVPQEVQKALITAYNNDGPGFNTDMVKTPEYKRISGRIRTIIPESSIVGMFLEHDEKYQVIHSTQSFILQHDPFSWSVDRDRFVYVPDRSTIAKKSDEAIGRWIDGMTVEERKLLVDSLFKIVESTNAKTLSDLSKNKLRNMALMVKAASGMDRKTKGMINTVLKKMFDQPEQNDGAEQKPEKKMKVGAAKKA